MWNPLPVVAFSMRPPGPVDRLSSRFADWQVAQVADVVHLLLEIPRVNLLLVGVEYDMWQPLQDRLLNLGEPLLTWYPGKRLGFPAATETGTLILHDVDRLSSDDQERLLDWLEPAGRGMRVISTTSAPLYPHVEAGAFTDTLYYRLNTVTLEIER